MASMKFEHVYIGDFIDISSNNEKINTKYTVTDLFYGEKTSEKCEIKMERKIIDDMLKNVSLDLIIGSDLSNEIAITNKTMSYYDIPYLGVYNACSSFPEEIIVGSSILKSGKFKNIGLLISSHNLNAERTYRFPIEYGAVPRISQTFTATASLIANLTKNETNIKVESCTIGKVIDYNIKDSSNMGAVMAPGAADTLINHLKETKRSSDYYDIILTGDLGKIGARLFLDILDKNDITISNYIDAGSILITDKKLTEQGASGPVCLPLVLFEKIIASRKYRKILILGTGSLHSTTMVNQKNSIPCISHAVSLEII